MAAERLELDALGPSEGASEALEGAGRFQNPGPLNVNHYANKKSAVESMLDIALLTANASQLKAVVEQGPALSLYGPLLALIGASLVLQVLVGVLLIFAVKWNLNDARQHFRLNALENVCTALVFIIVALNIVIAAFGIQSPAQRA